MHIKLFSPAKLNLFFRVLHKRPDGFHEIASLFQAISLGDFITIEPSVKDELICTNPLIPQDSSNLIVRAAQLFRQKTKFSTHFKITLEKNIPIEAGLGGGSSNAATTLWGLNQLLKTNISDDTLATWGAELGSDVPFFFSTGRAYCESRGEKITPVPPVIQSLYVVKPSCSLSTAAVYKACAPHQLPPRCPLQALQSFSTTNPHHFNDLETAAFHISPQLKEIKTELQQLGFDSVHMTGSGTSFFCLGTPHSLSLAKMRFWEVQFVSRSEKTWYKCGGNFADELY